MTDLQTPERGAEQASEGLPIPKLETSSPVGSTSSVDTAAIVKQVAEELRKELKMAQSTKDKEIAKIKKKLGINDLQELEERGATIPENVKLEYRLQHIEDNLPSETREQPKASPGNGAELTATEVSEVIKEYQLDANDPQVLEKLRGTYRNRDHFQATMAKVALAQVNRQPPSPSGASVLTSEAARTGDVSSKVARLAEYQKQPTKYKAEIAKLKGELDAVDWKD